MLKSELIALLSDPDFPDVEVLLSRDGEGNAFNVLYDVVHYSQEEDPDDVPFALDDAGVREAIVLWP